MLSCTWRWKVSALDISARPLVPVSTQVVRKSNQQLLDDIISVETDDVSGQRGQFIVLPIVVAGGVHHSCTRYASVAKNDDAADQHRAPSAFSGSGLGSRMPTVGWCIWNRGCKPILSRSQWKGFRQRRGIDGPDYVLSRLLRISRDVGRADGPRRLRGASWNECGGGRIDKIG